MLGQDDAVNSHRLCRAQQRAEIIDILDCVENKQEGRLVFTFGVSKNLLQVDIFARLDNRQAALVDRPAAELVEPPARDCLYGNMTSRGLL